jgi:hypothetical protein
VRLGSPVKSSKLASCESRVWASCNTLTSEKIENTLVMEGLAEFQNRVELFLRKRKKEVAGIAKWLEDQGIESKS